MTHYWLTPFFLISDGAGVASCALSSLEEKKSLFLLATPLCRTLWILPDKWPLCEECLFITSTCHSVHLYQASEVTAATVWHYIDRLRHLGIWTILSACDVVGQRALSAGCLIHRACGFHTNLGKSLKKKKKTSIEDSSAKCRPQQRTRIYEEAAGQRLTSHFCSNRGTDRSSGK